MKQAFFEIIENFALTGKVMRMRLAGDTSGIEQPGQFVDIRLENLFLRRPLSVCDWDDESFTVLYERVGRGTECMAALPAGERLDVMTGLGNGYDLSLAGETPLLIGGGTGLSPLYGLAKALVKRNVRPAVILGFSTAEEVFYTREFEAIGIKPIITTEDGSFGIQGFVTEAMDFPYTFFYACGTEAMLRAICEQSRCPGQISLGKRMGCGFGACMGCTVLTKNGPKRICKDGPVLNSEEVLWED
ncbi:MAG: dihydroorotate dehydrogenase electron transfer subunit [Oscillospiraceae bacterium]|nr:dihydroorotate dehydrogenase electron transfer subunit [Oscillospiraceae bacterium]MBO7729159.1 dihydroorotate dehydrogenase electron transfer subunit [Oscillospiraceae bacterium]